MRSLPRLLVLLTTAGLMLASASSASARTVECQHPTTTGEEAYGLHHVSARRACVEVRRLARYLKRTGAHQTLYRCGRRPFHAILRRHRFDRWSLRITSRGLRFRRGRSFFYVGGTDFPFECS